MKNQITTENLYQFLVDDDYIDLLSKFIKKQLNKDKKFDKEVMDVEIIYCTNDGETNKNDFRIKYTPYIEKERGIWVSMEDEVIKLTVEEISDIFNENIIKWTFKNFL